jgi:hypothetical protein
MSRLFLELNWEPAARFTRYRTTIDSALNKYTFVAVETCGYAAYVLLFTVVLRLYHPVLLRYDDGWYLLVSYSWLNGFGFTNHWGANPISSGIFNWHGFLQPLIISWLSPCRTLTCLNIGLSVVGVAYLALWLFIVRTLVSVPSYRWALYIIGVGAVLEFSARAELLASCIILLGTCVFVCLSDNRWTIQRGILIGVLLGLLIITHPAASILSATLIAATVAYLRREDARASSFLLEGFWCVVSAVCVTSLLLHFLFPFHDPTLWLHGIYEQIIANSKRNDAGDFLKYFLMTKMFPALIFPLMSLAIILVYAIKQRAIGKNRRIFAFFIIALVSFVVGLYYSSFRIPATFYNFSVFVPTLALLCFYCATSQCRNIIVRLSIIPMAVFALACALAQSIWLAQKIYYAPDYDRLASEINSLVARYSMENCRIAMDPPIATAVDDVNVLANTSFLFFGDPAKKNNNPPGVDVLLRAQTELSSLPVPNADFALVESKFYSGAATRFIKPESLYFALYKASSSQRCGPSKAN